MFLHKNASIFSRRQYTPLQNDTGTHRSVVLENTKRREFNSTNPGCVLLPIHVFEMDTISVPEES